MMDIDTVPHSCDTFHLEYLANCGLLIECGTTRILLDGLTSESSAFDRISLQLEGMMIDGCEPYDHIDLLLFTHLHEDHFDLEKTLLFLETHPETKCMLPSAITATLTDVKPQRTPHIYEVLTNQCILMGDGIAATAETSASPVSIRIGGLTVTYIATAHITFPCAGHFCIKISNGKKDLLFTADMDFDQLPLLKKTFDLGISIGSPQNNRPLMAFFNPILMGKEAWIEEVASWNPEAIFIYHIPSEARDCYGYRKLALRRYERYRQCQCQCLPQLKLLPAPMVKIDF